MMRRFFPSTIRQVDESLPFVFEINTANISTGSTINTQFTLPLINIGTYDFDVDWGDTNTDNITVWNQAETTHTYGATGTYTVIITGKIDGWRFANTGDRLKITNISQWGGIEFQNESSINNGVFWGCSNLDFSATDIPFFSGSLAAFFRSCSSLIGNSSINNWDVSNSNIFQSMFLGATNFNQPLGNWNMTNATNIRQMFASCNLFNQDIGGWDVSNVLSFAITFSSSPAFNQNLGIWNVSAGTDFTNFMFGKTTATFSTTNLDAIYNGWTDRILNPSKSISFGTAKHTAAGTAGRGLLARVNSTVAISNAVNNGSGLIRITSAAHGRTTGDKIFISGVTGTTEANGAWIVTVIDATTVDLQGSTFTNTYTSGGTLRTGYGWTLTDGGI